MYVFIFITVGIVVWLFLGNIVGFDKTPWPLLLVILNLPQLSIMISLQASANRPRPPATAEPSPTTRPSSRCTRWPSSNSHPDGQDRVLAILDNFASKDMPGRQRHIQNCVDEILAKVGATTPEAG